MEIHVDPNYLEKQYREIASNPGNYDYQDSALYRILTHAELVDEDELDAIAGNQGALTPYQRYRALDFLICKCRDILRLSGAEASTFEEHLTLLIFGRERLTGWYEGLKARYPDTELVLLFADYGDEELMYTCYFQPQPGCPDDISGHDFPLRHHSWEYGDMFWMEAWGDVLGLTVECYPDQSAWALPDSVMEDYRIPAYGLDPDDPEYDHLTVAQLLGFATTESPTALGQE